MTKAWLLLALVFLALERGTNGRDAEQASPPTHCLYSVQYVYSSVVHLVNNHPDNNGETSEYFCIYCTFVIKKTRVEYLFDSVPRCEVTDRALFWMCSYEIIESSFADLIYATVLKE